MLGCDSARYFPATVMGGRLHVTGVPEWGPWDSARLDWWPEDQLDFILPGGRYGEKVRTLEELEAALQAPMKAAPTRRVWIQESLEDDTQRLWERMRESLKGNDTSTIDYGQESS